MIDKNAENRNRSRLIAGGVIVIAIISMAIVVVRIFEKPADSIRDGIKYATDRSGNALAIIYRDGKAVAKRLLDGQVTDRFESYISEQHLVQELVLARIRRLEHQHRTLRRLNSEATLDFYVPVEYSYFVDMSRRDDWHLEVIDGELRVLAPKLMSQRPNVIWKERREYIDKGILIRGEDKKMEVLQDDFLRHVEKLARRPAAIENAKVSARQSLAIFLQTWISQGMLAEYQVSSIAIRFADEKDFPAISFAANVPEYQINPDKL